MFRPLALLLLAPVAALAVGIAPAAAASDPEAAAFVARTNATRHAHGLRPYAVAADLAAVARRHSDRMAARGSIYHNPNLASDVTGWLVAGENVGMGGDVDSVQGAFMRSPSHRANVLSTSYTQVGFATVRTSNGAIWVTAVFRLPQRGAAPARATRSVRTTPRPTAQRPPARRPAPARATAPAVRQTLTSPPATAGALVRAVAFCRTMRLLAR